MSSYRTVQQDPQTSFIRVMDSFAICIHFTLQYVSHDNWLCCIYPRSVILIHYRKNTLLNLPSSSPVSVPYFSKGNNLHTTAKHIYKTNLLRMRNHWIEYQKRFIRIAACYVLLMLKLLYPRAIVNFILPLSWPKTQLFVPFYYFNWSQRKQPGVKYLVCVLCSLNDNLSFKLYIMYNINPEYKNTGFYICIFSRWLLLLLFCI